MTALFADVVGSTTILERIDPEVWTGHLNGAFDLMSRAVYRYEGTIAHLLGDGLLAFFGTPIAHEDDPERAVRAALDMLQLLRPFSAEVAQRSGLEFRIRIGINTGPVIVGEVGSDLRYEYTAIGDAVNVAARIQAQADVDSVLVAEPTYKLVSHKFEVRPVGPLNLRGKAEPVMAYQILGLKAVPGRGRGLPGLTSSLIGRAPELEAVEALFERAITERRGAVGLIVGEPGIGKTRLMQELRLRTNGSARWVESRCISFGRSMPYHLLLDLLRSLLGTGGIADTEQIGRLLWAELDGLEPAARAEVYAYLGRLLGLPSPALASDIESLSEEVRHERLLASLNHFLSQLAAAQPMALICEDLHWADRSSTEALAHMMTVVTAHPVVLFLTSRPDPDSPAEELARTASEKLGDDFHLIRLEPLDQAESASLVAELLEIESLPPSTRKLILQKSEGNPLFVEEYIRMLIEKQAIVRVGHEWVSSEQVQRGDLPTNLQGLLLARIDRLPDEPKLVARLASVVGRDFELEVLSQVLQAMDRAADLKDSIAILQSYGLIGSTASQTGSYSFRHALIEEAVYESVLQRDRTALHETVGMVLEEIHAAELEEWAGVLAHHFERAGKVAESTRYLVLAGQRALRRFAPREAYDLFEKALGHLASLPRDSESLRHRVRASLGRFQAGRTFVPARRQLEQLGAVLADVEALGDERLLAEVHVALAEVRHELGEIPAHSPELTESLEIAEAVAQSLGDERLRALPKALRGLSHFAASELRLAVNVFTEAVPLLAQYSTLSQAAYYAGLTSIAAARLGEFDLADRWIERAQSLAERSRDPAAAMDVDIHRGLVEGVRGNVAEALAFARRGTEVAERIDNKACALVGHFIMGDQQLKAGLPEEALKSLQRSTEIAEFCNVADIENLSRAWLSAVRSELGDSDEEVLPRLDESLSNARRMGDRLSEGEILQQRAIVRARSAAPDWPEISADFESAIDIFERIEARPYLARTLRNYGITLQTGHRIGQGQQKLQQALELFRSMQMHQVGELSATED